MLELGNGVLGWDIDRRKVTLFHSGDRPVEATTVNQVCRAIIGTLRNPDTTRNTHIHVNSFTVTQNQILAVLERLTGDSFEVSHESSEALAVRGKEHLEQGDLDQGYPGVVTVVAYGPWCFLNFGERPTKWKKALGLNKEEDHETEIRAVLEKKGIPIVG